MEKISAVYKIVNTVTGEFYIGSSVNVEHRWKVHKCPSTWKKCPNNRLYKNFQKYGLECFRFQVLCPVMPEYLKQVEQELIEMIKPAYNDYNAKGWNIERLKETKTKYYQTDKCKEVLRKYRQSEKGREVNREAHKRYYQTEKGKEVLERRNKNDKRLCEYNGKKLTFHALRTRFHRAGIEHPSIEAKKYLL